jgi:hypothetical protein
MLILDDPDVPGILAFQGGAISAEAAAQFRAFLAHTNRVVLRTSILGERRPEAGRRWDR